MIFTMWFQKVTCIFYKQMPLFNNFKFICVSSWSIQCSFKSLDSIFFKYSVSFFYIWSSIFHIIRYSAESSFSGIFLSSNSRFKIFKNVLKFLLSIYYRYRTVNGILGTKPLQLSALDKFVMTASIRLNISMNISMVILITTSEINGKYIFACLKKKTYISCPIHRM